MAAVSIKIGKFITRIFITILAASVISVGASMLMTGPQGPQAPQGEQGETGATRATCGKVK